MKNRIRRMEACVADWVLQKQMMSWSLGCKLFIRDQHQGKEGEGGRIAQKETSHCYHKASAHPAGSSGVSTVSPRSLK